MQIRMYHNHTHMKERVKKLVIVDGRLILPRADAGTSVHMIMPVMYHITLGKRFSISNI